MFYPCFPLTSDQRVKIPSEHIIKECGRHSSRGVCVHPNIVPCCLVVSQSVLNLGQLGQNQYRPKHDNVQVRLEELIYLQLI